MHNIFQCELFDNYFSKKAEAETSKMTVYKMTVYRHTYVHIYIYGTEISGLGFKSHSGQLSIATSKILQWRIL